MSQRFRLSRWSLWALLAPVDRGAVRPRERLAVVGVASSTEYIDVAAAPTKQPDLLVGERKGCQEVFAWLPKIRFVARK
jgi:hypothetical protein